MSHSQQPCAACKLQRRKCMQECIFAPHFPPDQPQKFANIHKVFGASNVAKLLGELHTAQREEAVNSLAYEAEARLHDPVYGCLGRISILQHRLKQLHMDLDAARQELVKYIGPQALQLHHQALQIPNTHNNNSAFQQQSNGGNSNMIHMMGIPTTAVHHHQHHQQQQSNSSNMFEAQFLATELAAAREQQEMFRAYEQQQRQGHHHHSHNQNQEVIGFGSGSNGIEENHHHHHSHHHSHHVGDNSITDHGFDNEITGVGGEVEPCLALGSMDGRGSGYEHNQHHHHHQNHHHQSQVEIPAQEQLFFQVEQQEQPENHHNYQHQQQQQSSGSDEGRSLGPSLG